MDIKENDLVMCTVKSIEGTTVFIEIDGYGPGTLALPEVAAGRIRNLREYVSPNKKIVCKVLKIINNHPQLSLRRVTAKEREEVMERYQKEKTISSIIKTISKDSEKIISKIKAETDIVDLFEEARENSSVLEKFLNKEEVEKIKKILIEKKDKEKEVKRNFAIKSNSESGILEIKKILDVKDVEIRYLGSSKFSLTAKASDFKDANNKAINAMIEIQKRAKEKKAILEIEE